MYYVYVILNLLLSANFGNKPFLLVDHPNQHVPKAEASCEFVQAEMKGLVSSVGGWLLLGTIVLWCSPVGLRCSSVLPLDNSWLAIWLAVTVMTTRGGTLSTTGRRMVNAHVLAVRGEVVVFHHVYPDFASFNRDFIQ